MAFIKLQDLKKDLIVDIHVYRSGVEIRIGRSDEFARGNDEKLVSIREKLDEKNRIIGHELVLHREIADKFGFEQVFDPRYQY